MTPEQLKQILEGKNAASLSSELDVLDERELEVFSILGQGFSASQIESQFGIPQDRLRELKKRIQTKLGLRNEVQLLQSAVKKLRG